MKPKFWKISWWHAAPCIICCSMLTVCLLDGKTGYHHNGGQNLDGSKRWMFLHQFASWLAQMESIRGQFAHSILVPAGIWMLMMMTRTLIWVKASTPTTTMIMTCSRTPQQKVYYFNQQCISEMFSGNAVEHNDVLHHDNKIIWPRRLPEKPHYVPQWFKDKMLLK